MFIRRLSLALSNPSSSPAPRTFAVPIH
jgi:hypothetical protein